LRLDINNTVVSCFKCCESMTQFLVIKINRNNPCFDILFPGVLNQVNRKIKTDVIIDVKFVPIGVIVLNKFYEFHPCYRAIDIHH